MRFHFEGTGTHVTQRLASGESPARPFHYRTTPSGRTALQCGTRSLTALATEFATPLYVYSGDQILARFRLFQRVLVDRDHLICYAVKANSAPTRAGGWSECTDPG